MTILLIIIAFAAGAWAGNARGYVKGWQSHCNHQWHSASNGIIEHCDNCHMIRVVRT